MGEEKNNSLFTVGTCASITIYMHYVSFLSGIKIVLFCSKPLL